ncbi:MAG: protein kinase family protein [Candidatus Gastranaerophilales bacterium]|nr:protein kinase family protein [Candidatus Gastranaerophilales bacterium]
MYENYLAELRKDMQLTDEFAEFYNPFGRKDVILILSTLHFSLINLFKCMNERLPTKDYAAHFWADPSRELIDTIDKIETLQHRLKNSEYSFQIEEYNQSVINKCNEFLSSSGGSTIPEHMKKIELYYAVPIFIKTNTVSIEHPNNKSVSNLIPIGEGSYALTYKYHDNYYSRDFVIKRAKKDLSEKELKRFKQEFEIMKGLKSPYIVEVYSYDDNNNSYIMEYMDYTLDKFLKLNNDKISSGVRKSIILQLLKACKYLHEKGYLHRDLSPSNVLIKVYDDVLVVKIADFGLAKNPENKLTTVNTEFKGYFNDPNLKLEGFNNYSISHEIYALTMLVYFITTGRTNTSKITDRKLNNLVRKGLGDKSNRYKSVDELCEAYRNL